MIFPAKLTRITIVGSNDDKAQAITKLHELGVLHISETPTDTYTKKDSSLPEADQLSEALIKLRYIAQHTKLEQHTSITFLPDINALIQDAQKFIQDHLSAIEEAVEEKKECVLEQKRVQEQCALLRTIPFSLKSHDPQRTIIAQTQQKIDDHPADAKVKHKKVGKNIFYEFTFSRHKAGSVRKHIQQSNAKILDLHWLTTSKDEHLSGCKDRVRALTQKQQHIQHTLSTELQGRESRLAFLIAALEKAREQKTITNSFAVSNAFFVLTGYCEPKQLSALSQALPETHITAENANGDAPTKLTHGKYASWFAPVTELFSLPKYESIDPTRIIAFFFPLFFGFMLGDIGYGLLVMLLAGGIALHGSRAIRPAVPILLISGGAAIVFGILFGSFFGGLIPIEPILVNSFDAALPILITSLAIGLIHLNLGALLGAVQAVRNNKGFKKIIGVIFAAGPLLSLQAAGILFYLSQTIPGFIALIIAVSILIANKGVFGIMDVSGLFGTWFSYARLLALSLATAGVALAVNTIASQALALGKIGIIIWILIILIGHAFNFVMNVVGCTINAARLHYVEFFSMFFTGGGTPFRTFSIQEEKK